MTELLSRFRACATTDVEQAREQVAAHYCAHRLALGAGGHLDLVLNSAPVGGDVTLNFMRYGGEVRITPGLLKDFYLIQVPVAGHARLRIGERTVLSDRRAGTITTPDEPLDMLWSADCEKLVVYIRREAMESVAGTSGPITFEPRFDLTAPAAQAWVRLVHYGVDVLNTPAASMLESVTATVGFEQTLIGGLLSVQPNSGHEHTGGGAPSSRPLRTALELLEDRPEHPWRVGELAAAAGVSTRSLQELFARELETTPLRMLRGIRLERAHRELMESSSAEASVTDVAAKWGFFHGGRFAEAYYSRFRERPSETLAR